MIKKTKVALKRKKGKSSTPQTIVANGDTKLYQDIRELILTARHRVASGVDLVQVWMNFDESGGISSIMSSWAQRELPMVKLS